MIAKKLVFLVVCLLSVPWQVNANFVSRTMSNNGIFQGVNQNITVTEDFTNNGVVCGSESIYMKVGNLKGNGLIKAPKITIFAKKFSYTGTIECSEQGIITTQDPVDRSTFTLTGTGILEFRVIPNFVFLFPSDSMLGDVEGRGLTQQELVTRVHDYLAVNLSEFSVGAIESAIKKLQSHTVNKCEILEQLLVAVEESTAYNKQLIGTRDTTTLKLSIASLTAAAGCFGLAYVVHRKGVEFLKLQGNKSDALISFAIFGLIGGVLGYNKLYEWLNPGYQERYEKWCLVKQVIERELKNLKNS